MAIVSEDGLLSGKYSDWFVNDHMAGWLSVLGSYNPFGHHRYSVWRSSFSRW